MEYYFGAAAGIIHMSKSIAFSHHLRTTAWHSLLDERYLLCSRTFPAGFEHRDNNAGSELPGSRNKWIQSTNLGYGDSYGGFFKQHPILQRGWCI